MKPLVAVLAGGASPEHEVSLASGSEVLNGLVASHHPTLATWIAPDDRWHLIPQSPAGTVESWSPEKLRRCGREAVARHPLEGVLSLARRGVDVVFPALHGRGGEDGHVQALLDAAELAYVGSGRTAASIGMSKLASRLVFESAGLPMPRALLPGRQEAGVLDAATLAAWIRSAGLRYPVFLKADTSGSSLGVERVETPAELATALRRVRAESDYWLLEQAVEGVELTCAVLGNAGSTLKALPPVGIRPRQSVFFDYASKYDADATEELCPPPDVAAPTLRRVECLALAAHEVLGCRGFSRTDMILEGTEPNILEINTIPGLTPQSLLPKAAQADGLTFPELLDTLVGLALAGGERIYELPRAPRPSPARGAVRGLVVDERAD